MEQLENYYHYNPHHRKAYCEVKVKVLVTQSHLTVCNPMDCSPPGSSVHGILRQEHWSGQPFPSPEHLPDPGIKRGSPALQADSLPSEPKDTLVNIHCGLRWPAGIERHTSRPRRGASQALFLLEEWLANCAGQIANILLTFCLNVCLNYSTLGWSTKSVTDNT